MFNLIFFWVIPIYVSCLFLQIFFFYYFVHSVYLCLQEGGSNTSYSAVPETRASRAPACMSGYPCSVILATARGHILPILQLAMVRLKLVKYLT